jgi:hypothetical protein
MVELQILAALGTLERALARVRCGGSLPTLTAVSGIAAGWLAHAAMHPSAR